MESVFKGFRAVNDLNFAALKSCKSESEMVVLMVESLEAIPDGSIVRVHVSGDFFSEAYFKAWMLAAFQRPDVRFYAYTKSVHFLARNLAMVPHNFSLTVSEGGSLIQ